MNGRPSMSWLPPVAHRQAGAFSRRQAVEAGLSRHQVAWRIERGAWRHVAGAGYRRAEDPCSARTALHCAALTWPDGIVGLGTAARLHGLPVPDDGRVHVLLGTTRAPGRAMVPHEIALDPGDVERIDGVAVTTRRRTVLDCLGRLPADAALDLLAWVSSRRVLDAVELAEWIERHPYRWGNQARARAAERLVRGAVNPAEDRLHHLLHRAGLTGWRAGVHLAEHVGVRAQADVYFPAVRLVIEVDGRRAHDGDRFQADRTRQNALVAAGCVVLRYTWSDLWDRPDQVVRQIREMLGVLGRSLAA